MSAITSTVPAALDTLMSYFSTVAANSTISPQPVAVFGPIFGPQTPPNYIQVGDWETGAMIADYRQEFRTLPASAPIKNEDYVIPCNLRVWGGAATGTTPKNQVAAAFSLLDGVMQQLQTEPDGAGALSPSGTWQVASIEIPKTGPWPEGGWGVLITFNVHVFNVTIY